MFNNEPRVPDKDKLCSVSDGFMEFLNKKWSRRTLIMTLTLHLTRVGQSWMSPVAGWWSTASVNVFLESIFRRNVTWKPIMPSPVGNTLGHTFYMGTQNRSKLGVWRQGLLIHASELKLWYFEVFLYFCIGKPYICNVFRPSAMPVGVVTCTYVREDLTQGSHQTKFEERCTLAQFIHIPPPPHTQCFYQDWNIQLIY